MKFFFTLILILFVHKILICQSYEIHYSVKTTRQLLLGEGKIKEIALDYEGFIYSADSCSISFIKPQYLLQYPTGSIMHEVGENNFTGIALDMDTMQKVNLYYSNKKKHFSYDNNSKQFFIRNSELWPMKWKIMPETKIINGLQCKHAVTYNGGDTNQILFDIWYYPDISLGYGLLFLKNAPGLVVECNFPMMNMSYTLKYFKKDEPINKAVFWPEIFNKATFEDYTKPQKISEKDKKKSEIMGQ